jgi:transcriptional regulator with XRE-family HTH domain
MKTIDTILGERIRHRRLELGMTQSDLAQKIEVRFQQVQKYENGQNRVAASRLWQISRALDVPITYFFDPVELSAKGDDASGAPQDQRRNRELAELFNTLPDTHQTAVMSFLRSLVTD